MKRDNCLSLAQCAAKTGSITTHEIKPLKIAPRGNFVVVEFHGRQLKLPDSTAKVALIAIGRTLCASKNSKSG
jgi:hypothetical protein